MIRVFTLVLGANALMYSWSCRSQVKSTQTSDEHELLGTVLSSDGRPARDGIVIISNPQTGEEIQLSRTDSDGHFVVKTSIASVAFTAATNQESLFLPKVNIGQRIHVSLSRDCKPFHGKIALDDPAPLPKLDLIRIGGFGKDPGDLYGIAVGANFEFDACLPPAEYYVTFPPEFVERIILTTVPPSRPLEIRSVTRRTAAQPAALLQIPGQTRLEFSADLPSSTRLLGLGESNHGSDEFMRERTQLVIELARQRQFTLLMVEAGYGDVLALDDYIKGSDIDVNAAIKNLGYWTWSTKTFRDSLDDLREYNRTAPSDRRITLCGIDVQNIQGALDKLLPDTSLTAHDSSLLERLRERQGALWGEMSGDDRLSVRHILERIAVNRDTGGVDSSTNRHALSARSILLRLDHLEQQGIWNRKRTRDRGMARLAQEALELSSARGTLWAHLGHLAREYVVGARTMGGYLADMLGSGYLVYALLSRSGSVRARTDSKDGSLTDHVLPPPPIYSLEATLSREPTSDISDVTYWSFARASAVGKRWLAGLHWVLTFGAVYPSNNLPFEVIDVRTFDGVLLFKSVTPVKPIES